MYNSKLDPRLPLFQLDPDRVVRRRLRGIDGLLLALGMFLMAAIPSVATLKFSLQCLGLLGMFGSIPVFHLIEARKDFYVGLIFVGYIAAIAATIVWTKG